MGRIGDRASRNSQEDFPLIHNSLESEKPHSQSTCGFSRVAQILCRNPFLTCENLPVVIDYSPEGARQARTQTRATRGGAIRHDRHDDHHHHRHADHRHDGCHPRVRVRIRMRPADHASRDGYHLASDAIGEKNKGIGSTPGPMPPQERNRQVQRLGGGRPARRLSAPFFFPAGQGTQTAGTRGNGKTNGKTSKTERTASKTTRARRNDRTTSTLKNE